MSKPLPIQDAEIRALGRALVHSIIEQAYANHRLAYIWKDGDTPDSKGKPTTVYVCKCQEGFSRTGYNEHIKIKYEEVN